jgi:hypothetical protein
MIEIGNAFAMGLLQLLFRQESFGESDNEREADYQAYEQGIQSRMLITIILSLGLAVFLLAIRRGLQQREERLAVEQEQQQQGERQAQIQEEAQAANLLLRHMRQNLVWSLRLVVQFFRPIRRKPKEKIKRRRKNRKRRDRVNDEYGRRRQKHDHDLDDSHSSSLSSHSSQDSVEKLPNYNHVDEGEDLGSLPGSDSDLYELDELSSRHEEEDDAKMMDTSSNIPRVV